jgi:acyl-lipid omega-6 desaturase (Delta-12 desaturase)
MQTKIEKEIREYLKNWPNLVHRYAQSDHRKAIIQIINTFLPCIGLWVVMYLTFGISYWLTLGLALVNAFFMVRIFIIQHDCGHHSFFNSRVWNNIIGYACSFFSAIPYRYWARSHSFHHGHSGQLEVRDIGDIHTLTVKEFKELSRWNRFKYRIYRMPLVLFVLGPAYYMLVPNRLPLIKLKGWEASRWSMVKNNILLGGLYLTLGYLLGWKQFFLIQLPIVLLFAIIAVWFFFVQHHHEHTYKQWKENWEYLVAAIKGSTYYKLPKVFQWLTGNIGFHHIHHLNSRIPNYHLEKCARENPILNEFVTEMTFFESLKCMFHKLWDEETQRMISFREFYRRERGSLYCNILALSMQFSMARAVAVGSSSGQSR